ncbi:MAG: RnfABCDGE type electron transport complex subunit D [Candidatus Dactylopiibacterium sp.]|nr:RnfABCDGE type electron transport complex subunit D [Candidatus Dactylopiibacterium sp.]
MKTTLQSGPFAHADHRVDRTMLTVLLALLPATLFNLWLFGLPAILLFACTLGAALGFEALWLAATGRDARAGLADGSAAITGWLLALSLPPWAPWWLGVLGAFIAIVIAKHAYGGLGQNLFNPAMVARVALLVSFPVIMTAWVAPQPLFTERAASVAQSFAVLGQGVPDTMVSATPLGHVKTELSRALPASQSAADAPALPDLLLGRRAGSMGETSVLLILAGGLFLLWRRVITWHIPVALLGSLFAAAQLASLADPARYTDGLFHLLTGASFLGAFFIATDYVTSPMSPRGKLIYGAGCGFLTWAIRSYAGYPEGMAFAVLLMNALTPIIDQYTRPRVFGRQRNGEPLPLRPF